MTQLTHAMLIRRARGALQRGEYSLASGLCHKALRIDGKDVQAMSMLADLAQLGGQDAEATDYLEQCVQLRPGDATLRTRLGLAHATEGHHEDALAQLDRALRLQPDLARATVGKAMIYETQDDDEKALDTLQPVIDADAPSANAVAVYLRLLVRRGRAAEAVTFGEQYLAGRPSADGWLSHVHLALAKARERIGDVAAALASAGAAHRISPDVFDREAHRRRVDETIETCTVRTLRGVPRPSSPSDVPIFIVGMPRSGSTLVDRIIHSHPDAYGAGEIDDFLKLADDLQARIGSTLPYPRCIADLDQHDVDRLSAEYVEALRDRGSATAARVTDKNLTNFLNLGLVNALFPGGRVIHCRRDPLDTCISCHLERLAPSMHAYTKTLEDLGFYYRHYQRLMDHWGSTLDVPMLEVIYEELVADQESVTRRIIDFCGLPWNDDCLRFYEARRVERSLSYDQVSRPIYTTSTGRAERYGALLDPLRRALAGDV